jgi:hypothetical protein
MPDKYLPFELSLQHLPQIQQRIHAGRVFVGVSESIIIVFPEGLATHES